MFDIFADAVGSIRTMHPAWAIGLVAAMAIVLAVGMLIWEQASDDNMGNVWMYVVIGVVGIVEAVIVARLTDHWLALSVWLLAGLLCGKLGSTLAAQPRQTARAILLCVMLSWTALGVSKMYLLRQPAGDTGAWPTIVNNAAGVALLASIAAPLLLNVLLFRHLLRPDSPDEGDAQSQADARSN